MTSSDVDKSVSFFKRFRMEMPLIDVPAAPALPEGYTLVPWAEHLMEAHADIKFASFQGEVDAVVFPSLSTREGCLRLMREICDRPGFRPAATWLVSCDTGYCATVQGVRIRSGLGAIQNLGVLPTHRGRGLGVTLLLHALRAFCAEGLLRATLEVTAQNDSAVKLYRRIGFRRRRTLYRAVDAFSVLGEPQMTSNWYL